MRAGVLAAVAEAGGNPYDKLLAWAAGTVRRGWFGIVRPPKGLRWSVATYRCDRCGYLESYAQPG
jgi:hypothetical protein